MYRIFGKRFLDIIFSLLAIIILSPLLVALMIIGSIKMRGNPFFVQERPGLNERIFKLIKFRTMTNAKDKNGELLQDDDRLTKYGRTLRSTSLDELPELINILKGELSFVGPRPLLVEYLPYYTEKEHHRHDIRPGLTGLAQVNGRNAITWEEKFAYDLEYVNNVSFLFDVKIMIRTVSKTIKRSDVLVGKQFTVGRFLDERCNWVETVDSEMNADETTGAFS